MLERFVLLRFISRPLLDSMGTMLYCWSSPTFDGRLHVRRVRDTHPYISRRGLLLLPPTQHLMGGCDKNTDVTNITNLSTLAALDRLRSATEIWYPNMDVDSPEGFRPSDKSSDPSVHWRESDLRDQQSKVNGIESPNASSKSVPSRTSEVSYYTAASLRSSEASFYSVRSSAAGNHPSRDYVSGIRPSTLSGTEIPSRYALVSFEGFDLVSPVKYD